MRFLAPLLAALIILGCGRKPPKPSEPTATEAERYSEISTRLAGFQDNGWIVSRGANTNQGDSLFFTGLAMYGLGCDDGEPLAKAFETQLATGKLVRYPGNTDQVSFDGYLGFYRGVASRIARCGETGRWARALKGAELGTLPVGFDYVRQRVLFNLGLGSAPSPALQARMEADAAGFAAAATATHAACFRVHLSLVSFQMLEELGWKISATGRAAFCEATKGTRIATVEHFCGRDDLTSYLDNFQENVWIYQHQRCPSWETPDANGDQEPGVDYLVAYQDKALGA